MAFGAVLLEDLLAGGRGDFGQLFKDLHAVRIGRAAPFASKAPLQIVVLQIVVKVKQEGCCRVTDDVELCDHCAVVLCCKELPQPNFDPFAGSPVSQASPSNVLVL